MLAKLSVWLPLWGVSGEGLYPSLTLLLSHLGIRCWAPGAFPAGDHWTVMRWSHFAITDLHQGSECGTGSHAAHRFGCGMSSLHELSLKFCLATQSSVACGWKLLSWLRPQPAAPMLGRCHSDGRVGGTGCAERIKLVEFAPGSAPWSPQPSKHPGGQILSSRPPQEPGPAEAQEGCSLSMQTLFLPPHAGLSRAPEQHH